MEDNRRLINECNERLEDYARELRLLPEEIAQINHKLMLITMDICYQKIAENTREIDKIEEWVKDIRIEMKKKLIRKAENEQEVFSLYSYMHEVIEIFDLKYNPEERRRAQIERAQRKRAAAGKKEG